MIKVNEFFDILRPGNNTKVVMESSGMWYNIYESLKKKNLDVRLSNPTKTRAIASAKIKTDKLDAVKLADLLFSLASLTGGLAPSEIVLIFARVVQGLGAVMASATGLSILAATFLKAKKEIAH